MNIHKKTIYFMKYSIPVALLAAVRTLAECWVNSYAQVIDVLAVLHLFTFSLFGYGSELYMVFEEQMITGQVIATHQEPKGC